MRSKLGWCRLGLCAVLAWGLAGCIANMRPSSESQALQDSAPDEDVDVTSLADAVPERVVVTNAGNKSPYTVLGKTYHINFETSGFKESGYASWYGKKFHGNKTSNGEVYDMYAMTAAHKTLAIPTYVRVTNLENQRTTVVRVNDRGPFHDGRVIDLSYAAAKKLGYHHKGTAKVEIEVLGVEQDDVAQQSLAERPLTESSVGPALTAVNGTRTYLQLGAFSQEQGANRMRSRLSELTAHPVLVRAETATGLFKVLIGPIEDSVQMLSLRQKLLDAKLAEPHMVQF